MKRASFPSHKRRGVVAVFTAVSMVMVLSFAALAVDVGLLYSTRAELQAAADSAAHAGAVVLQSEERLQGLLGAQRVYAEARAAASQYAKDHMVAGVHPEVDLNSGNNPDGDVVLGYMQNPSNMDDVMSFTNGLAFNTVQVHVRRNEVRNGPVSLFFASVFGMRTANLGAEATASFEDGVAGFEVPEDGSNLELLPFAIHVDAWRALVQGTFENGFDVNLELADGTSLTDPDVLSDPELSSGLSLFGDDYAYHKTDGSVSAGSDGVPELNIFPGSGYGELPPGNFGTLDIGYSGNSTADLVRQIRSGVSPADLAALGSDLTVPMNLNGDTGMSTGIKDDLDAIIGQARIVPLFDSVWDNGNNATFRIVGFAAVRLVYVNLLGTTKQVRVQPAIVVSKNAISDPSASESYFVYTPVRIVR